MAVLVNELSSSKANSDARVAKFNQKLEAIVIPVSDVDRAKEFYGRLGWRLDADRAIGDNFRLVQFTPPGSACSVQFGTNVTPATPASPARRTSVDGTPCRPQWRRSRYTS